MNFLSDDQNPHIQTFIERYLQGYTISTSDLQNGPEYVTLFFIIFLKLKQNSSNSFRIENNGKIYECKIKSTPDQPRSLKISKSDEKYGPKWQHFDEIIKKNHAMPQEEEFIYKLMLANEAARRLDENDVYFYLPIFCVNYLFLRSDQYINQEIVTHQQIFNKPAEMGEIKRKEGWNNILYPIKLLYRMKNIITGIQKILANDENNQIQIIRIFIGINENNQNDQNDPVHEYLERIFVQMT